MPLSAERLIRRERLRTPSEHLGTLIEPPAAQLHGLLERPAEADVERVPILDRPLGQWRTRLREDLGLDAPVIVTGHQAEFFHAGVFAKSIAAQILAEHHGGQAVFLTVDSDLPKTAHLTWPQQTAAGLRRVEAAIPACHPQLPYEFQPRAPRAHWLQFFARVSAMYAGYDQALLPTFARAWIETGGPTLDYCEAMVGARTATEAALGLHDVRDVRLSRLCQTAAFRAFAAHLLLDARRAAAAYNAAQAAYRQRHHVRAAGRPVAPLLIRDDAIEVPFWVVRADESRRRLYVTPKADSVELATDHRSLGCLSRTELERGAARGGPGPLALDGWQLRPRALALSAFARLFVGDLFVHGIGGALYDEMMEDFVADWLGALPGPACCASATLRLPLPCGGVRPSDIGAARHQSHDLRHNPQRHLVGLPAVLLRRRVELVNRSRQLATQAPRDRAGRRLVFNEIRRVNEQMLQTDPWRAARYEQNVHELERQWRLDQIALDREYFYALHRQDVLEELIRAMRSALGGEE